MLTPHRAIHFSIIYNFCIIYFILLHITPLLYWSGNKRLSSYAQNAYWAQVAGPHNRNRIQNSDTVRHTHGYVQEAFHSQETMRQGRDSRTQQDDSYISESRSSSHHGVRNGFFCDGHMGNSSAATKNPRRVFALY